jgi:(p)ppGpp synthase/HD superfamily hydrolase
MMKRLDREEFPDFVRALAFASLKHSQQRRKDADASPYINHPIGGGRALRNWPQKENAYTPSSAPT